MHFKYYHQNWKKNARFFFSYLILLKDKFYEFNDLKDVKDWNVQLKDVERLIVPICVSIVV